jgi:Alpha/beta hydrolase domain
MAGFIDSGTTPLDKLAAAWQPTDKILGAQLAKPINSGPQHHYVVQAALWNLDRWIKTGQAPSKAPPMTATASAGASPTLVLDANGATEGGVRTPWVDVPVARLSGVGNSGSPLAFLAGVTEPFDDSTLARLYPGGKSEYLKKFQASLDSAIKAGFILQADKKEILDLAALAYHGSH